MTHPGCYSGREHEESLDTIQDIGKLKAKIERLRNLYRIARQSLFAAGDHRRYGTDEFAAQTEHLIEQAADAAEEE